MNTPLFFSSILLLSFAFTPFVSTATDKQTDLNLPNPATLSTSDKASNDLWKVVTSADNNQKISLSPDQKLFIYLHTSRECKSDDMITYTAQGNLLLQEKEQGNFIKNSSNHPFRRFFLFEPLSSGETTLTFYHHKIWSTEVIGTFTIVVDETR